MSAEPNQPSPLAEVRASLYSALALGFSAPDEEVLEELSGRIREVLREERSYLVTPILKDGIKRLAASIKAADRFFLATEYHRLFVGPYSLLVPPYESIYRETPPTIMGESTLEVLRMYEEAGFFLSPSFKDLPDHIAAELEFMALLCEEEGKAWQRDDLCGVTKLLIREETFLREHLIRWIPHFTSKILASTDSPVYRALESLLNDYVLLDLDCVRALHRLLEAEPLAPLLREDIRNGV